MQWNQSEEYGFDLEDIDQLTEKKQRKSKLLRKKKGAVARRSLFRKLSVILYCAAVFLLPIAFFPSPWFDISSFKVILVAMLVLGSGVTFLYSRIGEKIILPSTFLSIIGGIGLVVILSTIFSVSFQASFLGSNFEGATFYMIFLGLLVAALGSIVISTQARFVTFFVSFLSGAALLFLFHLLRFFLGPETLSFGVFTVAVDTPVGSWIDLAIFAGVVYLINLAVLLFSSFPNRVRVFFYITLGLSIVFLLTIHFRILIVALLILTVLLVAISFRQSDAPARMLSIIAMGLMGALFVFGGSLSMALGERLGTGYGIISPIWEDTQDIMLGNLNNAKNILVGNGPNTFAYLWQDGRSQEVLLSDFWSLDFNYGTGMLPTLFVTIGVIGGVGFLLLCAYLIRVFWFAYRREYRDTTSQMILQVSSLGAVFLFMMSIFTAYGVTIWLLAFVFAGTAVGALVQVEKIRTWELDTRSKKGISIVGMFLVFCFIGVVHIGAVGTARGIYSSALGDIGRAGSASEFELIDKKLSIAARLETNDIYSRARSDLALTVMQDITQTPEEDLNEEVTNRFVATLERAAESSAQATSIDPRNYLNWIGHGLILETVGMFEIKDTFESTAKVYAQARKENPTNPEIPIMQSRLELSRGNTEAARDFAREAITMKPNYATGYIFLANISLSEEDVSKAISVLVEATENISGDPVLYYRLGELYYVEKDYEKAVESFGRAIALDASYANARYLRGLSLYYIGDEEGSLRDLEFVLRSNSDDEALGKIIENIKSGKDALEGINSSDEFLPLEDEEGGLELDELGVVDEDDID